MRELKVKIYCTANLHPYCNRKCIENGKVCKYLIIEKERKIKKFGQRNAKLIT